VSEKYKFHDPNGIYFVTCTVAYWIDLFTRKEFKHTIVDSLIYCQKKKGLSIHAWCLMPSHLHLIISSQKESLASVIRDFKKHTSKRLVGEIKVCNESRKEWLIRAFERAGKDLKRISNYKVWLDGNQPKLIETNSFLQQKLDYVHMNPVAAEIVDEPEHYLHSSARDYAGIRGLIPVELT